MNELLKKLKAMYPELTFNDVDLNNEDVQDALDELDHMIDDLNDLEYDLDNIEEFNTEDYESEFDTMLDENQENDIIIAGISFDASTVLKECDPIAYRSYLNDFTSTYEDEYNDKRNDLEDEIQAKKDEIKELLEECDLISL